MLGFWLGFVVQVMVCVRPSPRVSVMASVKFRGIV
jgi:hypothetical protein